MTTNTCHKGICNLGYARVLVEMDAAKEIKTKIEIQHIDKGKNIKGSKKVQVMYDWMPPVCTHCKVFRHDKKRCMKGGAMMNDKTITNIDEKTNDNAGNGKGSQQDSNANVMEQGQWKNSNNEYNRNGGYANYKSNPQNQRQNNGSWRMGRPEINKKEYRKRQNVGENNMKNKESSNLNNNQWKVREKVVNKIRNSANKYSVLDSLLEDNDSELRTLKERMIVDKFLNDKVQPTIKESITWSKEMIEYFKTKWDEDRLKESFLRQAQSVKEIENCETLFHRRISPDVAQRMIIEISEKEIKNAMFDINDSKAPGHNGFTAAFLRKPKALLGYNRKGGPKRIGLKIDLQKAYDTVNWGFLRKTLEEFSFHERMVHWIMECVTTTGFTLNVNGERIGYFKGGRGLRQVMCHWDAKSVRVIKRALDEFSECSGMLPNNSKSTVFFGSLNDEEKQAILNVLPFANGKLPMKYLEVPLIAKRLSVKDFGSLLDKIKTTIIKEINRLLKRFLWNQGETTNGKAKEAWKDICKPKDQGGLGLMNLQIWNQALLAKYIWNIATKKTLYGSNGDLYDARINGEMRVIDMINNRQWRWPDEWYEKFSMTTQLEVPNLNIDAKDKFVWRNTNGQQKDFSMGIANADLCIQYPKVPWWKCSFAKELWSKIRILAEIQESSLDLGDIIQYLSNASNGNNIKSIIRRLAFASSIYNIWQERNGRIFRDNKRSCDELFKFIMEMIKSKLLGLNFKNSAAVREIEGKWNISCHKIKLNSYRGTDMQSIQYCPVVSSGMLIVEGLFSLCLPLFHGFVVEVVIMIVVVLVFLVLDFVVFFEIVR
nr:hypothetical protein [Tanacetum cinerariifolium]